MQEKKKYELSIIIKLYRNNGHISISDLSIDETVILDVMAAAAFFDCYSCFLQTHKILIALAMTVFICFSLQERISKRKHQLSLHKSEIHF